MARHLAAEAVISHVMGVAHPKGHLLRCVRLRNIKFPTVRPRNTSCSVIPLLTSIWNSTMENRMHSCIASYCWMNMGMVTQTKTEMSIK